MKRVARKTTPHPWVLPVIEDADIFAVQALANDETHRRAWNFIREVLCGSEKMTFWPGGDDGRRATDFAEGKRWVASQMRRIARLKPSEVDARGPPPAMPGQTEETD